jgi:hypothetical protein
LILIYVFTVSLNIDIIEHIGYYLHKYHIFFETILDITG